MSTTAPPIAPPQRGGRLLLWAGLLALVVGVVAYPVQMTAANLSTPWYAPALATVGTLLILVSLSKRVTVWRVVALLLVGAMAALNWWFVLSYTRLPGYSGPLAQGQPFPEFHATLADGTPFTRDNLKGDQNTVMIFFRGHW